MAPGRRAAAAAAAVPGVNAQTRAVSAARALLLAAAPVLVASQWGTGSYTPTPTPSYTLTPAYSPTPSPPAYYPPPAPPAPPAYYPTPPPPPAPYYPPPPPPPTFGIQPPPPPAPPQFRPPPPPSPPPVQPPPAPPPPPPAPPPPAPPPPAPPAPPPGPEALRGAVLVLDQLQVSQEGYSTYTLSLDVDQTKIANVYAMYGSVDSPLIFPPAFQMDDPWGSNVGPVRFPYSKEACSFHPPSFAAPPFFGTETTSNIRWQADWTNMSRRVSCRAVPCGGVHIAY
jgi:hypothetical protein